MNTGSFSDWSGSMLDIGPLYPFVGWETAMVIVLAVFWIGWHIVQIRGENRQLEHEARELRKGDNLYKAITSKERM